MSRLTSTTLHRIGTATGLRTMTRRKIVDNIKTMTIVVPLTLLLWVYAERAQLQQDKVKVSLGFRSNNPSLTVMLTEPKSGDAVVELSGPRGQIEQLRNRLDADAMHSRLDLAIPASDAAVGPHTIDLIRLLNDEPLIANSGVTVLKEGTAPQTVSVLVDQLITKEATVIKPQNLPQSLENIAFDPPTVTFSGPSAAMNEAFPTDNPTVSVDLGGLEGQLGIVGSNRKLQVPLVMPPGAQVTAKVQKVTMSFDLSSQEITDTIPSVPIEVRRPVGQDGQTKVVIGRNAVVIPNVRIRGPADKVRECVSGSNPQYRITAVVAVTADDRDARDIPKHVEFINVPPGVKVEDTRDVTISVLDVRDLNGPDR